MENKAFYYSIRFGKWMRKYHLGRSMIEILGVLAIIGMLSIGGLAAYRQAMMKYKTNQRLNFISQVKLAFVENCTFSNLCTHNDYEQNTRILCNAMQEVNCDSDYFPLKSKDDISWVADYLNYPPRKHLFISFYETPSRICENLVNQSWENFSGMTVSEYDYNTNKLSDIEKANLIKACYADKSVWEMRIKFVY